jgi:Prolyl oligopeptidase family.
MIQVTAYAQKIPLKHTDYDGWKNLKNQQISDNGEWITYEVNPQKGDGFLYLYQVKTKQLDSIARGFNAEFSPKSEILTFKIKAQYDTVRQAKLDKVDKKDMPKDSIGIWNLSNKELVKLPELKSFQMPKEKGEWMAYYLDMPKEEKDSLAKDSVEAKKSKKKKGNGKIKKGKLVIRNFVNDKEYNFENVTDYALARNGNAVNFIQSVGDSIQTVLVKTFDGKTEKVNQVFEKEGEADKACISANGDQVSFIFSADTTKNKCYELYYGDLKNNSKCIVDTLSSEIQENWTVSKNGEISFSRDGEKLFFGVAPMPEKEVKDTLLDEEKYHVDVWNWKDPLLQPQQKVQAEKEEKRTWMAVYHTKNNKLVQLADKEMRNVELYDKGNAVLSLGSSSLPYQQLASWDDWYSDYYLVNTNTGERELILKKKNSSVRISPAQKYLLWYETQDSIWYSYQVESKKTVALTQKINVNFYSETHDTPSDPSPYGLVGWTKGDKNVIIKDRYDLWMIDPSGAKPAVNLTNGYGRRNKIRFDYVKLDEEELFVDLKKDILLEAFHEFNKKSGYYKLQKEDDPKEILFEDAKLNGVEKAKSAEQIMFKRSTFVDYPNLWTSSLNFVDQTQVSDANPQQKNFNWGSVELVDWTSGDGEKLQGLLYKPEDFDPNKKYPMLVYFYERTSDRLHNYHVPQPNWSIINPSYCVSNGYLIFMPDITYHKVGFPGESAYSSIVTGTLAMMDRYDFIDKENVALQGQSWGGYQIAYLVTRTDLYKCAMAGAPVSNMTSAYGGIRWGSGMSRMFQYERTQSRIGGTLWNSTLQYIENSPVFFAPKIKTPLLIMHNDNDGAVPWYQGIELFVAMRRLQKPCWMLTYNNEEHNLRKRPNRMDLSIRTMQFFDYYLKGKPAPVWMTDGIPAVKKGKMDGYELKK